MLVKQRTPLLPNYNKAVQVGRTVINFSVKSQHTSQIAGNIHMTSKLRQGFVQSAEASGEGRPVLFPIESGAQGNHENNDEDEPNTRNAFTTFHQNQMPNQEHAEANPDGENGGQENQQQVPNQNA